MEPTLQHDAEAKDLLANQLSLHSHSFLSRLTTKDGQLRLEHQ
jgi:hypothetical protein